MPLVLEGMITVGLMVAAEGTGVAAVNETLAG